MKSKIKITISETFEDFKAVQSSLDENNPVWITAQHQHIPLADMTERHLQYCLNYCNESFLPEWIPILERELKARQKRYITQNLYFDGFDDFDDYA